MPVAVSVQCTLNQSRVSRAVAPWNFAWNVLSIMTRSLWFVCFTM